MSQSIIKITSPTSKVHVSQRFSIAVKEVACSNCSWNIDIPYSIILISTTSSSMHPQQLQEWVFMADAIGTYTITLSYRKRCCGKPTLQVEQYQIIVQ